MRKGKSSRRKSKRLKMGTTQIAFAVFFIALTGATVAANSTPEDSTSMTSTKKINPENLNKSYELSLKDSRGLFSPRMDYEQWKPLGRGDPLQNDPTYDYVPPVLERVHYWVESPNRKQDAPPQQEGKKSEILVLGVSSKKPSTGTTLAENRRDSYESFLKFIDGPKFYHHNHNSHVRPNLVQRPPQQPSHPYHSQFYKNKFDDGHFKIEEQRMPYTVLVPPPMPPPHVEMPLFQLAAHQPQSIPVQATTRAGPVFTPPTTTPRPTVSVQEASLVYHSTSGNKGGQNNWIRENEQYSGNGQYVKWKTPTDSPSNHIHFQESETIQNQIVFTTNSTETSIPTAQKNSFNSAFVFPTETGRIVFEQHSSFNPSLQQVATSISTPPIPSTVEQGETIANIPSDGIMSAQVPLGLPPAGNPTLHVLRVAGSQPTVTQMSVGDRPMRKGQVSDDTIGNTYVNIGKPNAHIQKEITTDEPLIESLSTGNENEYTIQNHAVKIKPMPALPPVFPNNQINSVYLNGHIFNTPSNIHRGKPFSRRPSPVTDRFMMQTMQTMQPPPPSPTTEKPKTNTKKPSLILQSLLQKETSTETTVFLPTTIYTPITSTTPTPTTTAVTSLTTDPLFKHYKQPAEPLRGPMYLIIQGHSKVKTYGPSNKEILRDFSMPEINEISVTDKYPVKHLHGHKDSFLIENTNEQSNSRSKNSRTLKDLLDEGIGNIDIRETELGAGYEVGDENTASSEKYHKGIVESEETELSERHKLMKIAKVRQKRQLEEFIPVVEDTVETYIYDFLKRQSEGSGVGAIVASAITNDSSEDDDNNTIQSNNEYNNIDSDDIQDDDDDEEDNDDDDDDFGL